MKIFSRYMFVSVVIISTMCLLLILTTNYASATASTNNIHLLQSSEVQTGSDQQHADTSSSSAITTIVDASPNTSKSPPSPPPPSPPTPVTTVATTVKPTTVAPPPTHHPTPSPHPATPTTTAPPTLPPGMSLPCLGQDHECVCDGRLPHQDPSDLQWYGTCISCLKGWTGWNCGTIESTCANGGTPKTKSASVLGGMISNVSATEECNCPPAFTGTWCEQLQCINAINGTGPHKTRPTDPYRNDCAGYCDEGWDGLACDMCKTNDVCPHGQICWNDVASVGKTAHVLCNVTGPLAAAAEGGIPGWSYMPAALSCHKPTGWYPNSLEHQKADGSCYLSAYRSNPSTHLPPHVTQPPKNTPPNSEAWIRWLDPYMYCTLEQCTQIVTADVTPAVFGDVPEPADLARRVLTYVTFGLCVILAFVVALAPVRVTASVGPKIVLSIFVFTLMTIFVAVFAGMMERPLLAPSNRTETVDLECAQTTCRCSDVPQRFSCSKEILHTIFPQLTGKTKITCNRYDGTCNFVQSAMPYFTIPLVNCHAAQCADPNEIPAYDKNTPGPGGSNADDAGNKQLFGEGNSEYFDLVWGPSGALFGFLGLLLLHFLWTILYKIPHMNRKWNNEILLLNKDNNNNNDGKQGDDDEDVVEPSEKTSLLHDQKQQQYDNEDDDDDNQSVKEIAEDYDDHNNKNENENTNTNNTNTLLRKSKSKEKADGDEQHAETKTVLKLENATYDVPEAAIAKLWNSLSSKTGANDSSASSTASSTSSSQVRTRVLHGVDLEISSGHSLALLGGSGSGKTTTLNIIAAAKVDGTVGGTLSVNGTVINNDPELAAAYRNMIGFVHQDDRLIEYLTVFQCIFHAARMRLPLPINNAQVTELVNEVIEELGLEECRDTLIGGSRLRGVSGGERRRVSIACELVGYSRLLLLDEPTSGLDALSARKVMQLVLRLPHAPLRSLQKFGRAFNFKPLVIFSIHQPSADIYALFDKVMVLVSGRRVVFGPGHSALSDALARCQMSVSDLIWSQKMNNNNNDLSSNNNDDNNIKSSFDDETYNNHKNNNTNSNNNNTQSPSTIEGVATLPGQHRHHHQQRDSKPPAMNTTSNNKTVTIEDTAATPTTTNISTTLPTTRNNNNIHHKHSPISHRRKQSSNVTATVNATAIAMAGGRKFHHKHWASGTSSIEYLSKNMKESIIQQQQHSLQNQNNENSTGLSASLSLTNNNAKAGSFYLTTTNNNNQHVLLMNDNVTNNSFEDTWRNSVVAFADNSHQYDDGDEEGSTTSSDDSSQFYHIQEQKSQQYVNPAELLLQVALELHNLFFVNNTTDNNNNTSYNNNTETAPKQQQLQKEEQEDMMQQQQKENNNTKTSTNLLLDPNSPNTVALVRGLNASNANNNNNSSRNTIMNDSNNNNKNNNTKLNVKDSQNFSLATVNDHQQQEEHEEEQEEKPAASNFSPRNGQNDANAQDDDANDDDHNKDQQQCQQQYHGGRRLSTKQEQQKLVHVLQLTNSMKDFSPSFWHQLLFLSRRSLDSFIGMFSLTAAHFVVATFVAFLFSFLYRDQRLDLAGTENKAGMITFLLLIVAFSSISCLELLVSERRVFSSDYDRGLYGVLPYFLVKVFFDFLPHRIMPTAILVMASYFPMGLRQDGDGIHFVMFLCIVVVFSIWNVAQCISIGLITGEFGTGALVCALVILWNTAFGGLMITPASIPEYFKPFKYISPQFYAYEASIVNELTGRTCVFNPVNSGANMDHSIRLNVTCSEFALNLGLNPNSFVSDTVSLVIGALIWIAIAILLMKLVVMLRSSH